MANPIIYKAHVETRFSDLDPYGHVNFKHYLDFVVGSRLSFLESQFGLTLSGLAKDGLAFYVTRAEINYLRPVIGVKKIYIESFVESIQNEMTLIIPFSIMDQVSGKIYANGKINFTVIDPATGKSTLLNDDTKKYFFE